MNKEERNISVDNFYVQYKKSMDNLKQESIIGIKEFLEECHNKEFNLIDNDIFISIDETSNYDNDSVLASSVSINDNNKVVVNGNNGDTYDSFELSADVWYLLYCQIYFYFWRTEDKL